MVGHVRRRARRAAAVGGAAALVLSLLGTGVASASGSKPAAAKAASGGTATYAEGPSAIPNYIFPMDGPTVFSVANIAQFQYLMYRPLYWFGNNNSPTVDYNYSLADKPKFSNGDKTVTITLKSWKWSDGEPVSARDVVFWMNLLKANPSGFGAYVPGLFPDNVVSTTATSPNTVVMQLNKAYNPTWFIYNELSQITPLPLAWDRTSLSSPAPTTDTGNLPDTTPAGAKAVYSFLDAQSKDTASWAGSPLWTVVDGPWKLQSYTTTGQVTMVPNTAYSGSPKPTISQFKEIPFTTSEAEFNLVKSGGNKVSVGYIPLEFAPQKGAVQSEGYKVFTYYGFDFVYFPLNFNNPTMGPVFKQLYVRQALQHLVDQPGWIHAFLHGAAVQTAGPVPLQPPNPFASSYEKSTPYPFSVSDATKLLTSHGWTKVGGVDTCTKPGSAANECGAGIKKGTKLSFTLDYGSGVTTNREQMEDYQTQAASAGVKINLTTHPFDTVVNEVAPCKPSQASCKWQAANWGAGWIYAPDYYPTGEELFATGAAANYGNWSDKTADKLIAATTTTSAKKAQSALVAYQDYIAKQVPVIFMPTAAGAIGGSLLTAIAGNLNGYHSNVFASLLPEQWSIK